MKKRRNLSVNVSLKETFFTCFLDFVIYIAGSAVFGLGIHMFAVPNNISSGGAVGVATIINHFIPSVPLGAAMLLINLPLFASAYAALGRKLFLRSVTATVIMSAVTDIMEPFIPEGTDNRLLASVFYGVCMGLGLSLIFLRGATTGGSDIPAKLISEKYPHISMGRAVFIVDCAVIVISGIAFGSIEDALYAAVVVFISGEIIDRAIYGSHRAKLFLVVTTRSEEITEAVLTQLGRGVSLISLRGGYTNEEKRMLICAVRASEAARLNKIIRSHDKTAFTIVLEAGEIMGEGFKITEGEE